MPSEIATGFLKLRAGTFLRSVRATIDGTTRVVQISECPVIWSQNGELVGDNLRNEQVELRITEDKKTKWGEPLWKEIPEKIGALKRDDMDINVYLPPEAFGHFWTAAEVTDGSICNIEVDFRADYPDILSVTEVRLIEEMPSPSVSIPANDRPGIPLGRIHPVVAELRTVGEQLRKAEWHWWEIVLIFAVTYFVLYAVAGGKVNWWPLR